jgi:hypothetical protein
VAAAPGVLKSVRLVRDAIALAKKCLEAAQQRQKAYADTKRSPVRIRLHDEVLLSTRNINIKSPGSNKFLPKWIGPFTVLKDIKGLAFKLALPSTMSKLHPVFHASLLKPYYPSGTVQPPPPIIDEEGDMVYFVETILDHRSRKSGRKTLTDYLIKWRGYSHEHNTWEPASNIMDPELIEDYEKRCVMSAQLSSRKRAHDDSHRVPTRHSARIRS